MTGNKKVLSNKWIFQIKNKGKYKARLVTRGCKQKYSIDYEENLHSSCEHHSPDNYFWTSIEETI